MDVLLVRERRRLAGGADRHDAGDAARDLPFDETRERGFFDCILNGATCLTGTDHAREVVRILSAAKQ